MANMDARVGVATTAAVEGLMAYRPHIDGLRAVSILSVVAFHVGVPGFSGGYVGVDIFFVISGFLIISQIIEALDEDRFSFAGFWARRAMRILPPYLLVIVTVALVAPFILVMPDDLTDFGRQIAYSAGMIVNHLFLLQQGYFDGPAETKVLLNLWSLSVEEQFYLFTPPFLAGLYLLIRRSRRQGARERVLWASTMVILLASLVACIALSTGPGSRNPAFYLTPLRAWEFVAGGAIGLILPHARRLSHVARSLLAPAGLVAIAISVFAFTPELRYPSAYALVPVAGAAAIILGGILSPANGASRLLAAKPMVAIGLVSYSWYLWHWPLISFDRIMNFGERDFGRDLSSALISLALAGLTYLAVERPIRRRRKAFGVRLTWRPVVAGVAASAMVAIVGWLGFQQLAGAATDVIPPRYLPEATANEPVCDLQATSSATDCLKLAAGRPFGLLVGDSMLLLPRDAAVRAIQARNGFTLSSVAPACSAMLGVEIFGLDPLWRKNCAVTRANTASVLRQLKQSGASPRYALLFADWPAYYRGRLDGGLGVLCSAVPAAEAHAFFVSALRNTIRALQEAGVDRTLVIGPTPVFGRPTPTCLTLADRYGIDHDAACALKRTEFDVQRETTMALLLEALAGLSGVRLLDPGDVFCDTELCRSWVGDDVLLTDRAHLGNAGLQRIVEAHAEDFAWLLDAAY
jgi:peptidoglycan/LPS O-acetylase OafA/YrhL